MSRIGSYGASQMYLSRLTAIQQRLYTEQLQVNTEKKSVNYTGISADTNRLINLENEKARAEKFNADNGLAATRLNAADISMSAIEKTMKNFRDRIINYQQYSSKTETDVRQLQEFAFQAMVDVKSYLGANINGQYVFSGGRVSDEPVTLPATDLETFQQIYDGNDHPYPTTRAASLQEVQTATVDTGQLIFSTAGTIAASTPNSLTGIAVGSQVTVAGASAANNQTYTVVGNNGTTLDVSRFTSEPAAAGITLSWTNGGTKTLTNAATGNLNIVPGTDTITATNAGSLAGLPVGTVFTISGSATGNDGVYQVKANTGTQITIESTKVTVGETVSATLSSNSWYRGDTIKLQHQIDADRSIDLGVYASDPAFDKAFRAMGLIAQGTFGTAGSLENNMERLEQARQLIQDGITRNSSATGPFGTEVSSDIDRLRGQIGVSLNLINATNEKHTAYVGFLDVRIINLENVDKSEAITRLLDDQTALQASYQALSTVRNLSLLNYMK